MITAGIDIGSITTKAAVLSDGKISGTRVIFTGYNAETAGITVFEELMGELHLERSAVGRVVSTGYGRNSVKFVDKAITEIVCHGAGAYYLNPRTRSVIDIGGQDSKAIVLDEKGKVKNFAMNDKCAAGTGRFLEVMAGALEVDLDGFGALSLRAGNPSKISSLCTVFAESEVISLISKGERRENIIAGIHESIAARIAAMANRLGIAPLVVMTGGVAKNVGVVKALREKLGMPVDVSEYAQVNGAIGAAVLAAALK
ncbi:MAG TPA: acyl-CoA dehydratase activase [Syntrophales bacterium]|nr:acyl-CoA dehydratase activase [Syntrophales bacterium]